MYTIYKQLFTQSTQFYSLLTTLYLQVFTFAIWSNSEVSTVHGCTIWIGKLAPVACWDTKQALYNLKGKNN